MTWKAYLQDRLRWGEMGYRLYVMRQEVSGSYSMMFNPMMQTMEPNSFAPEDKYFLDDNFPSTDVRGFLQAMSDIAWTIGIKPKQVEGYADELKAVRYHLEDMRKLQGLKRE